MPSEESAPVVPSIPAIPPVRTPLLYRALLGLVTFFIALLPVVYLAVVVGCALFCYWWATVAGPAGVAEISSGRAKLFYYAGPLFSGIVLLIFMVKPLFAPRPRRVNSCSLKRESEPQLFAFVDTICQSVRAPQPRRIDVNTDVNASASFRRGFLSFFGGDLVLTLGLPLVAGMSREQLAGVIAHEFGHFSQGSGMRLSYLIRSINSWFYRVANERDAWDERLNDWSRANTRLVIIVWLARLLVWLTRRLLWVLMWVSHVVSCAFLRQMEYDADRCQVGLTGSDAFAETMRRIHTLAMAHRGALSDLSQAWGESRLGDDLPELVIANISQIPDEVLAEVVRTAEEVPVGWLRFDQATEVQVDVVAQE